MQRSLSKSQASREFGGAHSRSVPRGQPKSLRSNSVLAEPTPLDKAIEFVLLAVIVLSPWMFGCTDAIGEFYLTLGLAAALILGCVRWLTVTRFVWRGGPTGLYLITGFVILALAAASHLITIPDGLFGILAPGKLTWSSMPMSQPPGAETNAWPAATSVAMYQGGSFLVLVRVSLLVGLALVIGSMPNRTQVLLRLSVVAAFLGTALAFFGLAQHFGSHEGLLYWTIKVEGGLGFGPFINRNHYPFFLNLALGLTIGLIVERLQRFGSAWTRLVFNDGAFAWLMVAAAVMISSLLVCSSRGGALSLFLAVCFVGIIGFRIAQAKRALWLPVAIAIAVMFLLLWVGFDIQSSRLGMLGQADRYASDGRWYLWLAAIQSVPQFPWLGSGGETYQFWETIHQIGDVAWNQSGNVALRADNEFLDVLNEYGLIGLLGLSIIAVTSFCQVIRSSRDSGLAMGGAVGVLAVLLHSFVDFGLRVPATGVFALVVIMLLDTREWSTSSATSSEDPDLERTGSDELDPSITEGQRGGKREQDRYGAAVSVSLAFLVFLIALSAVLVRRPYFDAERARLVAQEHLTDLAYEDAMLEMQRATMLTPQDALMRMEAVRVAEFVHDESSDTRQRDVAVQLILDHSRTLMSQCPLDWQSYAWIAKHDQTLDSDQQLLFVRKSRVLHPTQPDLAYLAGSLEHSNGTILKSLPHWKDSLATSLVYLPEICDDVTGKIPDAEWTISLLPPDPVVTFAAASQIDPPLKTSIFEHTLELLKNEDAIPRKPKPGQWQSLRARTMAELDRYDEAIAIMRRGLNQNPDNTSWRLMMARWCIMDGQLDEAIAQTRIVLKLDKKNREAAKLQQELSALKSLSPQAK